MISVTVLGSSWRQPPPPARRQPPRHEARRHAADDRHWNKRLGRRSRGRDDGPAADPLKVAPRDDVVGRCQSDHHAVADALAHVRHGPDLGLRRRLQFVARFPGRPFGDWALVLVLAGPRRPDFLLLARLAQARHDAHINTVAARLLDLVRHGRAGREAPVRRGHVQRLEVRVHVLAPRELPGAREAVGVRRCSRDGRCRSLAPQRAPRERRHGGADGERDGRARRTVEAQALVAVVSVAAREAWVARRPGWAEEGARGREAAAEDECEAHGCGTVWAPRDLASSAHGCK
ncbi:unnamed protein product [Pelagomonas calceolata]|uniref:Uncharacterized protein n=1 Tax=Pelagomonas calceolata TaxID=35677 RepID=A0A8J2WI03_9STRA|nr:unnamed protein product [Pelagomonas calceolata]